MELKEAEGKSLKESERLEKEIAEVQELKVSGIRTCNLFLTCNSMISHACHLNRKRSAP